MQGEEERREGEQEKQREEEGTCAGGRRGCRGDGPPLQLGPVAQGGVAAGDAHGVELARAELLVARGGDETGARGGTGLPVVDACKIARRNGEREKDGGRVEEVEKQRKEEKEEQRNREKDGRREGEWDAGRETEEEKQGGKEEREGEKKANK